MTDILTAIVPAVRRLIARHGLDAEEGTAADPFAAATPLLAGWAAGSVRGLAASGVLTQHPHRLGARREPDGGDAGAARVPGASDLGQASQFSTLEALCRTRNKRLTSPGRRL